MSSHSLKRLAKMIVQIDCCPDSADLHSFICWLIFFLWLNFSITSGAMIGFTIIIKMSFYIIYHNGDKKIIYYSWWCPTLLQSNVLIWFSPTCDPWRAGYGKQSRSGICEKSTCCRPKGCSDGKSVFETTKKVDWSEKEEERSLGWKTFHYLLHFIP